MATFIPITLLLLVIAWLLLRAYKSPQNSIDNAALLAELEEMDACLNRLDSQANESDRLLRELGIEPEADKPATTRAEPTKTTPLPANTVDNPQPQTTSTSENSASPCKNSPKSPKRKPPIPKTIEEYEATRKPLPPRPVYIPNPKALARFDEIHGRFSPPASPGIHINPRPSAVENPLTKKPALLRFCLTPLRLAARTISAVLVPVLRISKSFANFFARPKPPPVAAESLPQKRAA